MDSLTGTAPTPGVRQRKNPNWIDSFLTSTAHSNSPEIYRKWVGVSTIGAALQRKVYLIIQGERLFPNFYTILVGPPGVGKTRAIRFGTKLLSGLRDFALSPDALTREKLIDNLAQATKTVTLPTGFEMHTAYACFLDELSTFIRANDIDFMTLLTALFDCPKVWTYDTLGRGQTRFENLFLTLCGGITPKSIQRNWGEGAIGMGFTARLNMIYSEEAKPLDLFGMKQEVDLSTLQFDLQTIHALNGRISVTKEAAKELQTWVSGGMPPIPADSRFAEYNPRRSIHWLKLCIVYSVAESNELVITSEHVARAKQTLLEYEEVLPLAFEHMGQNPLLHAINSVHTWLKIEYGVAKQPIIEARVRRRLLQDVPPQYLESALKELVESGMATTTALTKGKGYIPVITKRID
jgi:hypothetical protein